MKDGFSWGGVLLQRALVLLQPALAGRPRGARRYGGVRRRARARESGPASAFVAELLLSTLTSRRTARESAGPMPAGTPRRRRGLAAGDRRRPKWEGAFGAGSAAATHSVPPLRAPRRPGDGLSRTGASSSVSFPTRRPGGEHRHYRLRLRQPALGRQGFSAGRAGRGSRRDDRRHVRPGGGSPRRPDRPPWRRAFADCRRGLHARARDDRSPHRDGARQGPALLRHLRRHAAHGDPRPRIRDEPRPRLDRRRRDGDQPDDPALKIPHMGWNTLHPQRDHLVLDGIATGPDGSTPISSIPMRSSLPT